MTKENDLILGVFANYGFEYPGIEAYMVSILRSGYTGRKVLLVWNLPVPVRNMLIRWGFELVDVQPPAKETKTLPVNFFIHRMKVAAEYLRKHHHEFRFVFWLDIKDLILQNDPSVWMEKNRQGARLIASTECVTLEQEETNNKWILDVCGAEIHSWLKDHEVINGGTFAGDSIVMAAAFDRIYDFIKNYTGEWPACQPAINYILRTKPFIDDLRIPRWSEGFAACLHPMWAAGQRYGEEWHPRDLCRPFLRDIPPALDFNKRLLYARTKTNHANMGIVYSEFGKPTEFKFTPFNHPYYSIELIDATEQDVPFSIVHGWDRDAAMGRFFSEAYAFDRLHAVTEVYRDYKMFLEKGHL
jgi:hypothetical protein